MKEAIYVIIAWTWMGFGFYLWTQGEPWSDSVLCVIMAAVIDVKREVVIGKSRKNEET